MASSFISFYRHFKLLICLTILIFDYCASVPIHHHLQPKYHHHRNRRHSPENERNSIRIPSSLCQGESFPLGMESGDIGDEQLTASSSYNLQSVGPQNARLNREISGGAWCPNKQLSAAHSGSEWIQVDLQDFYVITAIATQGRFGNGLGVEFAEEFWIEYSRDNGTTWNKWTDMNGDYKLPGNEDTYTPQKNILEHPLVAIRWIRLVPFASYQRTTCLRFELYGCRHDHTLPISYSIPDGYKGSALGDLRDLTYDGRTDFYGYLNGGLGQLTDGIRGDDNYKVNFGYEWIGWKSEGSDLSMVFEFNQIANFTSATFYCHNLFTKEIQVFTGAKVWFSYDGNIWSKRPLEFEYMPDLILEHSRDVVVHLHHKAAMFIKFDLQFGNKWILISEVTFNAEPIDENVSLTYEQLEPWDEDSFRLFATTTTIDQDRSLFPQATFLLVFGVLITIICTIVIFLLRLHLRRKEKAGHIVVCMKDLATTPLYCEPKDFSSTSSTISNTLADPEYAVPDVAISNMVGLTGPAKAICGSGGGHLNNNLNMFGSSFTRILSGNPMKERSKPSNSIIQQSVPSNQTNSCVGNDQNSPQITSNVVYSTQKISSNNLSQSNHHLDHLQSNNRYNLSTKSSIPYAASNTTLLSKTLSNSGTNILGGNGNLTRQYYLSGDLLSSSPISTNNANSVTNTANKSSSKFYPNSKKSSPSIMINQNISSRMTSNTIYNNNKNNKTNTILNDCVGFEDEIGTDSLRMRFNTNGYGQHQTPMPSSSSVEVNKNSQPSNHNYNSVGGNNAFTSTNNNGQPSSVSISNEFGDDMKCIPEISQKDIEILHRQFGCSQYGDLMLAQLSSATTTTKASGVFGAAPKNAINTNNNSNNNSNTTISNTVNDFGTETDTKNRSETFETNDSDKILVVLKTLQNEKLKSEFLHEMKSKWFISAKSERVGKLIGFLSSFSSSSSSSSSTLSSPISSVHHTAMVVECGDCDLAHFLRNCDKKSIGLQSLLFIGSEVAAGMKYLESLGYVHRDLSARNCLIYTGGKTLRVKITDFAAFLSTNSAEYCNGIALRWIAPEALINGAYTTKSDVFSYGVTLWEILTYALVRPHHELDDDAFLQKMFSAFENYINNDVANDCSSNSVYYQPTYATGNYSLNGCNQSNALCNDNSNSNGNENETSKRQGTTRISYRMALPKPTTCPSEIYDLMLECWQLNEQIRPSFKDITQFLSVRNSFSTANLNNCSNTNNTVNTELQNISSC